MLKSRLLIVFLRLLALLPLGLARQFGRLLGRLSWALSTRMSRVSITNIRLCLPELTPARQRALAKKSVQETFATMAEGGAVWLWPAQKILAKIHRLEGFDLLKAAYGQNRGVIVIGPHLGNWELVGLYLNTCGLGQTLQLFQAPRDPVLARLLSDARSRSGAQMVPTDNRGVGSLLTALRAGQVVGILPDQVPPESGGEYAPFFSVPALTMTLLPRLLRKTGARAIMVYAKRVRSKQGHGFEIIFREPDPRIYEPDLATSLAGLNSSVEVLAREAPEQYQWEYKRFKRQPAGRPNPYRQVSRESLE
ncbi:MAG: lysophospholipid acyltransferase family protein [Pseudohongiellaceae bacterium]